MKVKDKNVDVDEVQLVDVSYELISGNPISPSDWLRRWNHPDALQAIIYIAEELRKNITADVTLTVLDALKTSGFMANNNNLQQYYSVQQLVELWQVGERTVRRWIGEGKLKAVKLGTVTRIPEKAAIRFESSWLPAEKRIIDVEGM